MVTTAEQQAQIKTEDLMRLADWREVSNCRLWICNDTSTTEREQLNGDNSRATSADQN